MPKHKFKPIIDDNRCAECGSQESIELHHPIPISRGGTFVVPLCSKCHGKAHDYKTNSHRNLTKQGLRRAKEKGIRLGRTPFGFSRKNNKIIKNQNYILLVTAFTMKDIGCTQQQIAEFLQCSQANVSKILKRWKNIKEIENFAK